MFSAGETKVKGIGCKSSDPVTVIEELTAIAIALCEKARQSNESRAETLLKHPVQCFQRKSSAEMRRAYVGIDVCVHFLEKWTFVVNAFVRFRPE